MRYARSVAICLLGSLAAIFLVPIAVRRATWSDARQALDFPTWANWLLTDDAPDLPRDALYEPKIAAVYARSGARAACRAWLWRNLAHNLWRAHGAIIPATRAVLCDGWINPSDDEPTLGTARYWERSGTWEWYSVRRLFTWRGRMIGLRLRFGWKLQPLYVNRFRDDRMAQLTFHASIRRLGPVSQQPGARR